MKTYLSSPLRSAFRRGALGLILSAGLMGPTTLTAGSLQRELYTNVFGLSIADLTNSAKFPNSPDQVDAVPSFETPSLSGDNYGERLRGYLLPPVTGDYVFYVASDDQGALYLSPDNDPTHKVQIAYEANWSFPRSWTGIGAGRTNEANISAPIHLQAGRPYYVEALHKEGGGGDNFGVAWQMPGDTVPAIGSPPIPGDYLQPWGIVFTNHPPAVLISSPGDGAQFTAGANILLGAEATDFEDWALTVEFFAGTNFIGRAAGPSVTPAGSYLLIWSNVPAGSYVVRARATDSGGLQTTSTPIQIRVHSLDALVVTSHEDSGPGSLREVLARAPSGSTITFAITGTVALASGPLKVNNSIRLHGPGAQVVTIARVPILGAPGFSLFEIAASVVIEDVTIRGGWIAPDGTYDDGAGIQNRGTLVLNRCVLTENNAAGEYSRGGGICNFMGARLLVNACTFSANAASGRNGEGGAIYNYGYLALTNSTFSGNSAGGWGGAVHNDMLSDGTIVDSCTFTANHGQSGGGIFNRGAPPSNVSPVVLRNTILVGNEPQDVGHCSLIRSGGYNLIGSIADPYGSLALPFVPGPGDRTNATPAELGLGALQLNGGPTPTHALLQGSIAINAGPETLFPKTDQRGIARPFGPRCDIGAVECDIVFPVPPTITHQPGNQSLWVGQTAVFSVDATGTPPLSYQWQKDGLDLTGATNSQLVLANVQISTAGFYRVRVANAQGTVLSDPAALAVRVPGPLTGDQQFPAVASDGTNFLVVWEDSRGSTSWDIYAARVGPDGALLDPGGFPISTNIENYQHQPAVAFDGTNYLVVWADDRDNHPATGLLHIYGARVSREGVLLDRDGFLISGSYVGFWPAVAFNGTDYLVVSAGHPTSQPMFSCIIASRVTPAGVVRDPTGLLVSQSDYGSWFPSVASLGRDWMVAWKDGSRVGGARVSADGVVGESRTLSGPAIDFGDSRTALAALKTNYLLAWVGYKNIVNNGYAQEIRGTRVGPDGVAGETFTIFAYTNVNVPGPGQVNFKAGCPAVTANAAEFLVTWQSDYVWTNGADWLAGSNIRGALVPAAGLSKTPFPICMAPQNQSEAKAASNGRDFLVAWQDARSAPPDEYHTADHFDVYAARINGQGQVLEPNGFLVSAQPQEVPIVTWAPPADITYGTALGQSQLNATANVAGQFIYVPAAGTVLNAGPNQILTASFIPADTVRYATVTNSVPINVRPAALTIRADDKTKLVGAPNPPLTASYSGFVNHDTPANLATPVTLTTTATAQSPAGIYPILASGAADPNYTIAHLNGTLTVLPLIAIESGPISQTRFLGQTAAFTVQASGTQAFSYQWFFNGALVAGATASSYHVDAVESSDAGLYSVALGSASGSITSAPARLTVLPLPTGPGSLDITFDPTGGAQFTGLVGARGTVNCFALQPDGKLLVGGSFAAVNARPRNNLARLCRDGTLDENFAPGFGTDGAVNGLAIQSDGKVLIVGAFTRVNGQPRSGIARVYPDGGVDETFQPAIGSPWPTCIALQRDGKIIIGGNFTNVAGLMRKAIARLNPDGTADPTFDAGATIVADGAWVSMLKLQRDGKVLVGGQFRAKYNEPLVRLNPDGSPDAGFTIPQIRESVNIGWVYSAEVDMQDRIWICGYFLTVNDQPRQAVARLLPDGSLDPAFKAGTFADEPVVCTLAVQSDSKVIVGGKFERVNGVIRRGLARLNSDGGLDASFDAGEAVHQYTTPWVSQLALDAAGRLVVAAGLPDAYCCQSPNPIVRLDSIGAADSIFSVPKITSAASVRTVAAQPDRKVLVALQDVALVNGLRVGPVVRLLPDGTLDPDFQSAVVEGSPDCLAIQPDGKLLLGGNYFVLEDQTMWRGLIRLNSDGTLDQTFQTETGEYSLWITDIAPQPDGRILVNGEFWTIRGAERSFVARLNPNGTIDPTFTLDPMLHPNDGEFNPPINCIAVEANGQILIGGWFDDCQARLIRLNSDGSYNRDLLPLEQVGGIDKIILQPDGRILLGGQFNITSGVPWLSIIRLRADGTIERAFASAFNWISDLTLQPDGKVLAAIGYGPAPTALVRYNVDGSKDPTFVDDLKAGYEPGLIRTLAVDPIGQVLVAGSFSSASGIPWNNIARLNNDVVLQPSFVTRQLPGQHGPTGNTVLLVAEPAAAVAVYAVQESPPANWLIVNISHGGVFDPLTRSVKFGPFFDNQPRTLSYVALPPPDFHGVGLFSGTASADGQSSPIVGDERILIAPPHPADLQPQDWRIAMDEVTAYAAAWRTGGTWLLPPIPIPIDYVTRAAALWRGGEMYVLDPNIDSPPLWWVNPPVLPTPVKRLDLQPNGSALRLAPRAYVPGEALRVWVQASPASDNLGYALEETLPTDWTVLEVSHGGQLDLAHRQLKWGPFCDSASRTLSYTLLPPSAASGAISFAGRASFDGIGVDVQGPGLLPSSSHLRWTRHPTTGQWSLELKGELGARYVVETSTDLRHWTVLTVIPNTTGSIQVPVSVSAGAMQLFYRARVEPNLRAAPGPQ